MGKPLIFNAYTGDREPAEVRCTRLGDRSVQVRITASGADVAAVVPGNEWDRAAWPPAASAAAMADAVLDVLAPYVEVPDGDRSLMGRVRYPVIRFEYDGQMVVPGDAALRALAEQIVTRIRTAVT